MFLFFEAFPLISQTCTVSNTYALSAAHCAEGRNITLMGLLIGEHDISKGNETSYTALLKIAAFVQHHRFDNATNANDIALIRTQTAMTFSPGVQPVCLPFKFRSETFFNRNVEALGW
jgi:secreted trypsin-like serine protease